MDSASDSPAYYSCLPEWPRLEWGLEPIDGLLPTCRIRSWKKFEAALSSRQMNVPGIDLIFRGQRRHEWQLTPTLGRYTKSGVVDIRRAEEQKREFRLAMRGRGIGPELLNDDNELWAFGQHHGLATPLLDWTKSPFVALFFAFCDPDLPYEDDNGSRAVFVINKTALEALTEDGSIPLIVQPLQNDHTRLVNQAGLFTISPLGSDTLVTRIMNLLGDTQTVNMDDPEAVGRFIFKIHIPNEDRLNCLNMLRKMNIHHGSLFPDPIGASLYCNEWFGGRIDGESEGKSAKSAPPPSATKPNRKPKTTAVLKATHVAGFDKTAGRTVTPGDLAATLRAAGVDDRQIPILVPALEARYLASAPTDWVDRGFASAAVSVDIKRILRMNGLETERVEEVARAVLKHFSPKPEQTRAWPFTDFPKPTGDANS